MLRSQATSFSLALGPVFSASKYHILQPNFLMAEILRSRLHHPDQSPVALSTGLGAFIPPRPIVHVRAGHGQTQCPASANRGLRPTGVNPKLLLGPRLAIPQLHFPSPLLLLVPYLSVSGYGVFRYLKDLAFPTKSTVTNTSSAGQHFPLLVSNSQEQCQKSTAKQRTLFAG